MQKLVSIENSLHSEIKIKNKTLIIGLSVCERLVVSAQDGPYASARGCCLSRWL